MPQKEDPSMTEMLKDALCFMDPKKRMAGQAPDEPEAGEQEATFLLTQIRLLSR